ncbi:hypothetical protein SDC9_135673 [bioreactor metagenome]|uniref:Uncharacterized protein n=1 Tax=bioreactor metagenome TaxID=1076179 RepID=A0A645DH05_9ZZZZ
MDRLTLYDGCGSPDLIACMDCGPGCGADNENCGYCERPNEAYARLAAYENLCLTPEEIEGLMVANGEKAAELARLRAELERVTAERDAAVEELYNAAPCFACVNFNRNSGDCFGAGRCRYVDEVAQMYPGGFKWRVTQEAGRNG